MKPIKSSHKIHKTSGVLSMRKEHISKRHGRSRSPSHLSRSSRHGPSKHISPGLKKLRPDHKRKSPHSPRLRSIASSPRPSVSRRSNQGSPISMDRIRSVKRHKFEKRELSSSPVAHHAPISPHASRHHVISTSPYHGQRYPYSRSAIPDHYASPAKKKLRRGSDSFHTSPSHGISPPRGRGETTVHSGDRLPHRSESVARASSALHRGHRPSFPSHSERDGRSYEIHNRPIPGLSSTMSPTHSKDTGPLKSYDNEDRYRSSSMTDRYLSENEKFGLTLHERFSNVVETNRNEPRVRYSKEDLKKITIDIRRNPREHSPTLRHIINPSEVKLVRRANEGHRPIFDREEIKQATRDLREDAYYERKMSGAGLHGSSHSLDLRDFENYEITRHRFDVHHTVNSSSGRTLSDRWQNSDMRKERASLEKDHRAREYERDRDPTVRNSSRVRSRSRSAGDRDFRFERYPGGEPSSSRSGYPESHRPGGSSNTRDIPPHRKDVSPDLRHRSSVRRENVREIPPLRYDSRGHYRSPSAERHRSERIPGLEPDKWDRRSRSHSRESKLPDFSRRPDKYNYKPWLEKPDSTPRGPSYFEHDNREGYDSYRGRSSARPFRSSRGFRSRGFRGVLRGGVRSRGSFRGFRSSLSPRGRGSSRRGRYSPSLWEHDLYSRSSQDRKPGSHGT